METAWRFLSPLRPFLPMRTDTRGGESLAACCGVGHSRGRRGVGGERQVRLPNRDKLLRPWNSSQFPQKAASYSVDDGPNPDQNKRWSQVDLSPKVIQRINVPRLNPCEQASREWVNFCGQTVATTYGAPPAKRILSAINFFSLSSRVVSA